MEHYKDYPAHVILPVVLSRDLAVRAAGIDTLLERRVFYMIICTVSEIRKP